MNKCGLTGVPTAAFTVTGLIGTGDDLLSAYGAWGHSRRRHIVGFRSGAATVVRVLVT